MTNLLSIHTERLEQILSEDELKRAYRFFFKKDRHRFIVGRGLLRTILGCYLKKRPNQLRFHYSLNGKPELIGKNGEETLKFNVSYSNELILYAVALNRKIGIDLEYIRPDFADTQIVERFFSKQEAVKFLSLPKKIQKEAFFTCWTRKEAYLKATGKGITLGMNQFEVSLVPGEPAKFLSINNNPKETPSFCFEDLNMGSDYKAALAVEGFGWKLRYWQC
jgi:4'-phosphopantetheinyl transferase